MVYRQWYTVNGILTMVYALTIQGVIYFQNTTRFYGTCIAVTSRTSYEELDVPCADLKETQKRHKY